MHLFRGRLKLVVTNVRNFQLEYVDDFATKDELIDANMASAHIPFFLDGRPFASYRCATPDLMYTVVNNQSFALPVLLTTAYYD